MTTPTPELARDAQIRTIARDVLKVDIDERYAVRTVDVFDVQTALNAAFLAGMDFQRKQVQP